MLCCFYEVVVTPLDIWAGMLGSKNKTRAERDLIKLGLGRVEFACSPLLATVNDLACRSELENIRNGSREADNCRS